MLEPYDGKLSRTVLRREGGGNTADPADYAPLVERLHGQVIHISPASTQYINPMDINSNYSEEDNPLALKADFVLSLCELVVGGKEGLQPVEKTVIDRCVHVIYRKYFENPTPENMPLLEDLYNALLTQDEPEARHVAAALEIYVKGSLNIFNHHTNVDIHNRIVCFDIKQLGKQLKKLGMLIVQDAVWGRVTANRSAGKSTRYYADEFHLLLKEEQTAAYSVEIWKRFRKWGGIHSTFLLLCHAGCFIRGDLGFAKTQVLRPFSSLICIGFQLFLSGHRLLHLGFLRGRTGLFCGRVLFDDQFRFTHVCAPSEISLSLVVRMR